MGSALVLGFPFIVMSIMGYITGFVCSIIGLKLVNKFLAGRKTGTGDSFQKEIYTKVDRGKEIGAFIGLICGILLMFLSSGLLMIIVGLITIPTGIFIGFKIGEIYGKKVEQKRGINRDNN